MDKEHKKILESLEKQIEEIREMQEKLKALINNTENKKEVKKGSRKKAKDS